MKKNRTDEIHYYEWRLTPWFSSETRCALDAAGRGIYRELLDACYAQGSFPDDPSWICRQCACTRAEFDQAWPLIVRHFPKARQRRHSIIADLYRKRYRDFIEQQKAKSLSASHKRSRSNTYIPPGENIFTSGSPEPHPNNDNDRTTTGQNNDNDNKPSKMPCVYPDWQESADKITDRFISTGPDLVTRIIHAAVQSAISTSKNGTVLTDNILARIIESVTTKEQRNAVLYLTTVPPAVANEVRAHERNKHQ